MSSLKVFCLACLLVVCVGGVLEYRVERHLAASGIPHTSASHWLTDAVMMLEALAVVSLFIAILSKRPSIVGKALTFAGAFAIAACVAIVVASILIASELGAVGTRRGAVEMGECVGAVLLLLVGGLMLGIGGFSWSIETPAGEKSTPAPQTS
ncbi:MAG: hypothetical protein DCC75_11495 [Proteobacteria bacterium]|nr:MAG: hypothetical protein DCC75_11495 [Pseudomonadota bacterium]